MKLERFHTRPQHLWRLIPFSFISFFEIELFTFDQTMPHLLRAKWIFYDEPGMKYGADVKCLSVNPHEVMTAMHRLSEVAPARVYMEGFSL